MSNPNVFISYSHDDQDHMNWVLKLATNLRSHGVDVILDQFDLRIGKDIRFFMESGLSSSSLVICICSEKYVEKVDNGIGGAGYEGMILTQELLRNANKEYIIPIVRNNSSDKKTPLALGSKNYIDFTDDKKYFEKYRELLERIYAEDVKKKPPLGLNPFSNTISEEIDVKTRVEAIKYSSLEMDGHVVFRYDNNNGIYSIGMGEYQFDTRWSRAGNDSIHAYGKIGFNPDITEMPEYKDIVLFDFSSNLRTLKKGQLLIVENKHSRFAAIKLGTIKSAAHGHHHDEMEFDYHIYYNELLDMGMGDSYLLVNNVHDTIKYI